MYQNLVIGTTKRRRRNYIKSFVVFQSVFRIFVLVWNVSCETDEL